MIKKINKKLVKKNTKNSLNVKKQIDNEIKKFNKKNLDLDFEIEKLKQKDLDKLKNDKLETEILELDKLEDLDNFNDKELEELEELNKQLMTINVRQVKK